MPVAGYGSVDVLTPQYDGESWSSRNTRLLAIRKERSRDAARSRRGKENYEFYELAKLLPLPAAITSQLDKASIIRLSISYLRMRDFSLQGDPIWEVQPPLYHPNQSRINRSSTCLNQGSVSHEDGGPHSLFENNLGANILQALDGFLFTLCSDGRFLYISETVSIYLGLSQVELTGSSIFDYVHQADHLELADQLGMKLPQRLCNVTKQEEDDSLPSSPTIPSSPSTSHEGLSMSLTANSTGYERSFLVRMKSTLTKRGVNFRSSGYKVIYVTGSLRPRNNSPEYSTPTTPEILGFVGLAMALPPPTFNELRLEPTSFVCKVSVDFTITYCDEGVADFIDYSVSEVVGHNLYSFLHAQDVKSMRHRHLDMLSKGQTMTGYFRWMCKKGGYVWMQATAILLIAKNTTDSAFIFIMQVISEIEHHSVVMDIRQMSPDEVTTSQKESLQTEKKDAHPGNTSSIHPKDSDEKMLKSTKNGASVNKEEKSRKRKAPSVKKVPAKILASQTNGDIRLGENHCHHDDSKTTRTVEMLKPVEVTSTSLKMAKKLETFNYQNNNSHCSEEVLKVPNIEKYLGRKKPPQGRYGNSLPSSPTSLGNFQTDSDREVSERQTSSLDLPINESPSRVRASFPAEITKMNSLCKDVSVSTSDVSFYAKGDVAQIPVRDAYYSSPHHPFMLNTNQAQYSPVTFSPFGQFSSLQQLSATMSLASRGYHPSSFSNTAFLKGYHNPHDIPMDLSYNLTGYSSTPMPIMHTGVMPSMNNSFPSTTRSLLTNGESHNSIDLKSNELQQIKS